ncbi:hypothetical protein GCM10008024_20870 [Allgaiera indica]|uniref:Transposase DDE domain-containing protein n=1 Tax=Allgaiera indica TaxID=765699 RepID=A0AAN4URF3_9RHOB|nr:hypothetical protein GCM10008024_20870 [Allgaiera indica]
MSSILQMAGLDGPVPDFSTLSRRQKTITVEISSRRAAGPLNLLVAGTGIKFLGDGEWLARKHGAHRRRQYRKVHLAMDTGSGDTWPWNSRQAARATAPSCRTCWTRSRRIRRSAP